MRLPRLFRKPEPMAMGELFASDGPYSGLFVGWFLDAPTADALALETDGAVPAAELHVTVCYGGDLAEIPDIQVMRAIENARQGIEYSRPMAGKVSGVGRFQAASEDEGDLDVIYAGVDVPGLAELHTDIRNAFTRAGFPGSEHGFTPHITLAYVAPGSALPVESVPELPLVIGEVTINAGRFTETITLGAAFDAMPAEFGEWESAEGSKRGRTFVPFNFAAVKEPPEWIPYMPIPGQYQHPVYGNVDFSRERLARFVSQFKAGVYQEHIPLDAEHQTKTSGAMGWIEDLRQNADGSVDARIKWNDRGRALLADDRYRYVSADYFDEWPDPSGTVHKDVICGGALCTKPYFKESVLRPLSRAASETPPTTPEEGTMSDNPPESKTASEPIQLADVMRQLSEERAAREAAENERKTLAETVSKMAADTRRRAFTEEVEGRSHANNIRWFGDIEPHVAHLESLAKAFGEDSAEVKFYVEQNRSRAKQLSEFKGFKEIGHSAAGAEGSALAKLEAKAKAFSDADPKLTKEQAFARAVTENADLYAAYRKGE